MSQLNDAADAIRRAAKQYEVFVKAAEVLEIAGSLDNAAKEAQKARDAAIKQKAKAEEALVELMAKMQAIKDEAVAIMVEVKEEAKTLTEKAEADAKLKANAIIDKATQTAELTYNKLDADKAKAQDELEKLTAKITEFTQASSILDVEIALKQKQLDSLTASLEKLKAKLA